jgi:uncharacterized protein YcaQ
MESQKDPLRYKWEQRTCFQMGRSTLSYVASKVLHSSQGRDNLVLKKNSNERAVFGWNHSSRKQMMYSLHKIERMAPDAATPMDIDQRETAEWSTMMDHAHLISCKLTTGSTKDLKKVVFQKLYFPSRKDGVSLKHTQHRPSPDCTWIRREADQGA